MYIYLFDYYDYSEITVLMKNKAVISEYVRNSGNLTITI